MSKSKDDYLGERAVAWLATSFVLFAGLGTCTFIVLMFSADPAPILLATVGGILGFAGLLWILRNKQRDNILRMRYGWLRGMRAAQKSVRYRFGRKSRARHVDPQTNQPPTADQIRQIRDESGLSTWVPSDYHARRAKDD